MKDESFKEICVADCCYFCEHYDLNVPIKDLDENRWCSIYCQYHWCLNWCGEFKQRAE